MAVPSVSVVVTAYNHGRYVGEAVESVLAQSLAATEIIVVDDGSTDDTWTVLQRFGTPVQAIRQSNRGVAGARNSGVRRASGELIAFLDGDDRWHPDKLKAQVHAYLDHPDTGLVACDARFFDGARVERAGLFPSQVTDLERDARGAAHARCFEALLRNNPINTTSQVMIPRHVLNHVGLSDVSFHVTSDYDLYLRIAAKYPLTFVCEALTDYRYVPTSVSGPQDQRHFRCEPDVIAVLRKHLALVPPPLRPLVLAALRTRGRSCARLMYYYGCSTDAPRARKYLRDLLLKSGFDRVVAVYWAALLMPKTVRNTLAPHVGGRLVQMERPEARRL